MNVALEAYVASGGVLEAAMVDWVKSHLSSLTNAARAKLSNQATIGDFLSLTSSNTLATFMSGHLLHGMQYREIFEHDLAELLEPYAVGAYGGDPDWSDPLGECEEAIEEAKFAFQARFERMPLPAI